MDCFAKQVEVCNEHGLYCATMMMMIMMTVGTFRQGSLKLPSAKFY